MAWENASALLETRRQGFVSEIEGYTAVWEAVPLDQRATAAGEMVRVWVERSVEPLTAQVKAIDLILETIRTNPPAGG